MNLLDHLDVEQLFQGIVGHSFDEGLRLHRMTNAQVAHFEAASEAWGVRAHCTAGVQMAVRTDAEIIELVGRIFPGARSYAGVDVEVNGQFVGAHRLEAGSEKISVPLAASEGREIREWIVTLPQAAIVEIDAINVPTGSVVEVAKRQSPRLLCLGDSITQGMDARGPVATYTVQLARLLDSDLLNQGVGGHIFDVDALDPDLPFQPDLVTIAYGTNDWSRELTADEISDRVDAYIKTLLLSIKGAEVVVVTPIWRV